MYSFTCKDRGKERPNDRTLLLSVRGDKYDIQVPKELWKVIICESKLVNRHFTNFVSKKIEEIYARVEEGDIPELPGAHLSPTITKRKKSKSLKTKEKTKEKIKEKIKERSKGGNVEVNKLDLSNIKNVSVSPSPRKSETSSTSQTSSVSKRAKTPKSSTDSTGNIPRLLPDQLKKSNIMKKADNITSQSLDDDVVSDSKKLSGSNLNRRSSYPSDQVSPRKEETSSGSTTPRPIQLEPLDVCKLRNLEVKPPQDYDFKIEDYGIEEADLVHMNVSLSERNEYGEITIENMFLYFYVKNIKDMSTGIDMNTAPLSPSGSREISPQSSPGASPRSSPGASPRSSPGASPRSSKSSKGDRKSFRKTASSNFIDFITNSPKLLRRNSRNDLADTSDSLTRKSLEGGDSNISSPRSSSPRTETGRPRSSSQGNRSQVPALPESPLPKKKGCVKGIRSLSDLISIYHLSEVLEDIDFRERCQTLISRSLSRSSKECHWCDVLGKGFRELCDENNIDKRKLQLIYDHMPFLGYLYRLSSSQEVSDWVDYEDYAQNKKTLLYFIPEEVSYQDRLYSILYMTPEYYEYKHNPFDNVAKRIRAICTDSKDTTGNQDARFANLLYVSEAELIMKILQIFKKSKIRNPRLKSHITRKLFNQSSKLNYRLLCQYRNLFDLTFRKECVLNGIQNIDPFIPNIVWSITNFIEFQDQIGHHLESLTFLRNCREVCEFYLNSKAYTSEDHEKGLKMILKTLLDHMEKLQDEHNY